MKSQRAGHGPVPLAHDYDGEDSALYGGIITQVTTRGPVPPPRGPIGSVHVQGPPQGSPEDNGFGDALKSILCCGPPATKGGYVKADSSRGRHAAPGSQTLIGAKRPEDRKKKTLVLDLDETLVHSSFKPVPNPDYIIPVDIDGKVVDVYVIKRPWCDHFMSCVGDSFEVVVFTASLAKYADPLLDLLDKGKVVRWRLFREACVLYEGNFVKNLSMLGRDLSQTIIVDNSPHSYIFQPENAMPVSTFIDDLEDRELLDILPLLTQVEHVNDVRAHLPVLSYSLRTTDGGRLEPILAL